MNWAKVSPMKIFYWCLLSRNLVALTNGLINVKRVTARVVFAVTPPLCLRPNYGPDASALSARAAGTSLPSFLVSTLLHPVEMSRLSGLNRIIRNQLNVTRPRLCAKVNRCLFDHLLDADSS